MSGSEDQSPQAPGGAAGSVSATFSELNVRIIAARVVELLRTPDAANTMPHIVPSPVRTNIGSSSLQNVQVAVSDIDHIAMPAAEAALARQSSVQLRVPVGTG